MSLKQTIDERDYISYVGLDVISVRRSLIGHSNRTDNHAA